jgi:hypothetical protein
MCKRIQTFWNLCYLQREAQSLCALTLYLNVLRTLTCLRAVIRIFRVTPQHPARVRSAGGKWYVLVVVDAYSRYAWVFFLEDKGRRLVLFEI